VQSPRQTVHRPRTAQHSIRRGDCAWTDNPSLFPQADADDLFVDAKRHRVCVSCGEGVIDVFDSQTYRRLARIPTVAGARTSFFSPEIGRFMLALRATAREPAAIWLFRPVP
jgi:hypothetical protein